MSLHYYVANKDEILEGLVDPVFSEIWNACSADRCMPESTSWLLFVSKLNST